MKRLFILILLLTTSIATSASYDLKRCVSATSQNGLNVVKFDRLDDSRAYQVNVFKYAKEGGKIFYAKDYSFEANLYISKCLISDNGDYVVAVCDNVLGSPISLYKKGVLVKRWTLQDLYGVDYTKLRTKPSIAYVSIVDWYSHVSFLSDKKIHIQLPSYMEKSTYIGIFINVETLEVEKFEPANELNKK